MPEKHIGKMPPTPFAPDQMPFIRWIIQHINEQDATIRQLRQAATNANKGQVGALSAVNRSADELADTQDQLADVINQIEELQAGDLSRWEPFGVLPSTLTPLVPGGMRVGQIAPLMPGAPFGLLRQIRYSGSGQFGTGAIGAQRTFSGLEVGSTYRVTGSAISLQDDTPIVGKYRFSLLGGSAAAAAEISDTSTPVEIPALEFIATEQSHTVRLEIVAGDESAANLVRNPSPQESDDGWYIKGVVGDATIGRVDGAGVDGDYGFVLTINEDTETIALGADIGTDGILVPDIPFLIPVTPGSTIRPSVWMKISTTLNVTMVCIFYNEAGDIISFANSDPIECVADSWTELFINALEVPAGAAGAAFTMVPGGSGVYSAGFTLTIDHASTSTEGYVDGNTPGYAWAGTPYESESYPVISWAGEGWLEAVGLYTLDIAKVG